MLVKTIAFWLLILFGVLALLYPLLGYIMFSVAMTRRDEPDADRVFRGAFKPYAPVILAEREWFYKQNFEDVFITAFDGLKLVGRFLSASDVDSAKGTLLLMHGYQGEAIRDFTLIVRHYHQKGYNILLPDQRAHSKSEGRFTTFGILERYDCFEWIKFLNIKLGADLPLYLWGVSMGAATVMMTAGGDLPSNVKGCIADCGYTSPKDIFSERLKKDFHLPSSILVPAANIFCKSIAGFDLYDFSPEEAMRTITIPVFFVHGLADTYVPSWMSDKNYVDCIAEKKLFHIEGAGHAVNFMTDEHTYSRQLDEFLLGKV